MRIREEYKRSGYFWLHDSAENKVPGTLLISDGGDIELEIVGLLDNSIEALNGADDLSRIIGHIEEDGLITLENCFYKNKNISFGGISKSLVCVNQVLSGVAYDKGEAVKFNTLSFSIEGLDEWLGISGIKVTRSDDYRSATISYTPQQEIIYKLDNGFQLHILFGYTLPGFPNTTEAKITQKAYFKLSSETERDICDFTEVVHQVTYLLCFAVDATVAISDVSATSNSIVRELSENKTRPVEIKVYYPSLPFSQDVPKIDIHRMLFTFGHIRGDAGKIINNWLGAYDEIAPSLNLYFSAVTGVHRYLEGKFLALAQGLETYHRRTSDEKLMDESEFRNLVAHSICHCPKDKRKWLRGRLIHGNEINLGVRIKKIIEPFKTHIGSNKERSKLMRDIVNTRNYLTHYSENLKSEAVLGVDMWPICQKMEAIFQLHLLEKLGFSSAEISAILNNSYKLKQKIGEAS